MLQAIIEDLKHAHKSNKGISTTLWRCKHPCKFMQNKRTAWIGSIITMHSSTQNALKKFEPRLFPDLNFSKLFSFLKSINNFSSTDFFLLLTHFDVKITLDMKGFLPLLTDIKTKPLDLLRRKFDTTCVYNRGFITSWKCWGELKLCPKRYFAQLILGRLTIIKTDIFLFFSYYPLLKYMEILN